MRSLSNNCNIRKEDQQGGGKALHCIGISFRASVSQDFQLSISIRRQLWEKQEQSKNGDLTKTFGWRTQV